MSAPITVDVDVRYRDLDTMNHVNNAVYASYFEEARVAYVDEVFDVDLENLNFVIAHLEIDFGRPLTIADDPIVTAAVTDLGDSSATMAYELQADGDAVASGESTLVFVDPDTGRPGPIPSAIRERIVEHEGPELEE